MVLIDSVILEKNICNFTVKVKCTLFLFILLKYGKVLLAAHFAHENTPSLGKLESQLGLSHLLLTTNKWNGPWASKWPLDLEFNFFQAL